MSSPECHPQRRPYRPRSQRPQQPLQQQPAAKGSLRSLLIQHSSTRLYVHPLEWTTLHLSLLCCLVINDQLNAHDCFLGQGPWQKDARELWKELQRSKSIGLRNDHSRQLIQCLGFNAQRDCQIRPGYVPPLVHLILEFHAKDISAERLLFDLIKNQSAIFNFH